MISRFSAQILAWRRSCREIAKVIHPESSKMRLIKDIGARLPFGMMGVFNEAILWRVRSGEEFNLAAASALADVMDMLDQMDEESSR